MLQGLLDGKECPSLLQYVLFVYGKLKIRGKEPLDDQLLEFVLWISVRSLSEDYHWLSVSTELILSSLIDHPTINWNLWDAWLEIFQVVSTWAMHKFLLIWHVRTVIMIYEAEFNISVTVSFATLNTLDSLLTFYLTTLTRLVRKRSFLRKKLHSMFP